MTQKHCPSYDGYSITNDGIAYTHRRRFGLGKGAGGGVAVDWKYQKKLNQYEGHGGYMYVSISTPSGQRSVPIHALLMDAFVGPRPAGMEIRHLDGNPKNNSLSNLCYGTRAENANDRVKHKAQPRGQKHGRAKLSLDDVEKIKQLYQEEKTIAYIARLCGVGESTVRDIVKGRNWKHA